LPGILPPFASILPSILSRFWTLTARLLSGVLPFLACLRAGQILFSGSGFFALSKPE
jgi:hypothetical protein